MSLHNEREGHVPGPHIVVSLDRNEGGYYHSTSCSLSEKSVKLIALSVVIVPVTFHPMFCSGYFTELILVYLSFN